MWWFCLSPDAACVSPLDVLSCRLSLCSAAWPPAATSVAACAAAVTAAVESVNLDLGRHRTRTFMCPLKTWRLSCSLTREVKQNRLPVTTSVLDTGRGYSCVVDVCVHLDYVMTEWTFAINNY